MIISAIRSKLATDTAVTAVVPSDRILTQLRREAQRPYIMLHRIDTPPAEVTLDGSSGLRDGEFQFDCYADTQIDAQALSELVQAALQDFGGTLDDGSPPDGSTIQFVGVTADGDDAFEVAGKSFVFRSFFRMKAFYTEA